MLRFEIVMRLGGRMPALRFSWLLSRQDWDFSKLFVFFEGFRFASSASSTMNNAFPGPAVEDA